jgi:ankyrin repeat protein
MNDDIFFSVQRGGAQALEALSTLLDVNVRNSRDENLLHTAIAYRNAEVIEELIRRDIDVNAQSTAGSTPLHYAAEYGDTNAARLIVSHGGDVTIADQHGNTPLWTAVVNARGKYELVELLLQHGAAEVATRKNLHGKCPLDFATQIGDAHLTQLLQIPR